MAMERYLAPPYLARSKKSSNEWKEYVSRKGQVLSITRRVFTESELRSLMRYINEHKIPKVELLQCQLNDADIALIAELNESITTLYVRNNQIGSKGFQAFVKLNRHVKSLDVEGNQIGSEGLQYFSEHDELVRELNASFNGIEEKAIQAFVVARRRLISADLNGNALEETALKVLFQQNPFFVNEGQNRERYQLESYSHFCLMLAMQRAVLDHPRREKLAAFFPMISNQLGHRAVCEFNSAYSGTLFYRMTLEARREAAEIVRATQSRAAPRQRKL